MDGNKDEALRCVLIAKEAIASRNKDRALKFIKIAQRLNGDLPVDELLSACESLDARPSADERGSVKNGPGPVRSGEGRNEERERNYNDEHVQLIRQIKRNVNHYAILGVEKTCSVEEIRKAYRKLSLKVHPDKNKAPGAEEAFKKLCKAFKCLSDLESRRQYDQTGLVDGFEYNQQPNVRRRQRRTAHDLFDDDFDPDEIFRSFFGQRDMFRSAHVYRTRTMGRQQQKEIHGGGSNILIVLLILPFLLIVMLAYLPFSEPEYALHRNYSYHITKTTGKYGVDFYVKSSTFDEKYPLGSPGRDKIEDNVIRDVKSTLWRHCHVELQRRQWSKNFPTPHCDRLQNLGLA